MSLNWTLFRAGDNRDENSYTGVKSEKNEEEKQVVDYITGEEHRLWIISFI